MKWKVEFHPAFEEEIHGLSEAVVVEILAGTKILGLRPKMWWIFARVSGGVHLRQPQDRAGVAVRRKTATDDS